MLVVSVLSLIIKTQVTFFTKLYALYFRVILLLCWGLTTRQPLWVILCRLTEKGRKVIEEIVEEIKERGSEEIEETRAGVCKTLCPQLPDSNTV